MLKHRRGSRFYITKLHVKNFRSVRDAELAIGDLTVLVGPNASGKSNLMDALRFVSDAFRWDLERAISYRNGIGAISRRRADTGQLDFEVGICAEIRGYCVDYKFHIVGKFDGSFRVAEESCEVSVADESIDPIYFCIKDGFAEYPKWFSGEFSEIGTDDLHLFHTLRRLGSYRRNIPDDARALPRRFWEFMGYLRSMRFYHIFPDAVRDPQKVSNPNPLQDDGSNMASTLARHTRRWFYEYG